jgi:hypothetical protein
MTVLALTIGRYGGNNYDDTITTLMQGREKKKDFSTYTDNDTTQCRCRDA